MSTQEQIQKKSAATMPAPHTHSSFEPRGFTVQTKANSAPGSIQQSGNLKTQLSRATRFGHNLSQMPAVQTKTATGQSTQAIQRQEAQEEPEQMKAENSVQTSIQRQPAPAAATSGGGNSMPKAVRSKMENSFGTSFSDVNIQTNSAQAKSIGALAYTQGNNVHFAPGQYNPESAPGQALLGHELTHVIQQRAGRVPVPHQSKGAPINADTSLEKEADDMGAKAARGEAVQMPGASGGKSVSNTSPVQNSTEPVQCFLPAAMFGLDMLGKLMPGQKEQG